MNARATSFALLAAAAALLCSPSLEAQNDNPTGPTGQFNGNSTTAGSYDPYTGNATRTVTDLTVNGAVGAYPLEWSRTMNSRQDGTEYTIGLGGGGGWRHSYSWSIDQTDEYAGYIPPTPTSYTVHFPDGRTIVFSAVAGDTCFHGPLGLAQRFQPQSNNLAYLLLADGGKVEFTVTNKWYIDADTGQRYSWWAYQATAIIDPNGLRTVLSYNTDGTLFKVTEPAGRWLQLTYTSGRITRVDARQGSGTTTKSVSYGYTTQLFGPYNVSYTLLTGATYLNESGTPSATYTYQPSNISASGAPLIATCDDPHYAGPMKKIAYDFETASGANYGQLKSEKHPNGTVVATLTISGNSRVETRGDSPTALRTWTYGNPTQPGYSVPEPYMLADVTDFLGHHTSFSFDSNGFQNTILDSRGGVTTFTRLALTGKISTMTPPVDAANVTQAVQYSYDDPTTGYYLHSFTDGRTFTTTYLRDGNHRVYEIDYPDGGVEGFVFGNYGRVTRKQLKNGSYVHYTVDTQGLVAKEWNPTLSQSPVDAEPKKTITYYPAGHAWENYVNTVTDQRGNVTTYEYDRQPVTDTPCTGRGLISKITYADGNHVQFTYNIDGTLQSKTDELGHTTSYLYDDYKRVVSSTDARLKTTHYDYTRWNSSSSYQHTSSAVVFRMTSPLQKLVDKDVDDNFRVRDVRFEAGKADDAQTNYTYDEIGNLSGVQDARGNWTLYGYDLRNRRIWVDDPINRNSDRHTTTFTYDQASNPLTERRANNQLITYDSYDQMNRLTQKTERRDANPANDMVTNWTWYPSGKVHTMTDPRRKVYTYGYGDLRDLQTSLTYPLDAGSVARQEGWTYDLAGNLDTFTNRAGAIQTFVYDNRNRETYFSWNNGTMARTTGYDAASNVLHVGVYDADVDFTYNETNQVLTDKQTNNWTHVSRTVTNTYDDDGNRRTLQYPNGSLFTYDYTGRNQMKDMYDAGGNRVDYAYDLVGNRISRANPWGTRTDYGPADALNRIPYLTHTFGNGTARYDYGFDALSRRTYERRDSNNNTVDGYTYDLADQVTGFRSNGLLWNGVVSGGDALGVTYDANGNRISTVANSVTTTSYTNTSDANQYGNVGGAALAYDGDANLTGYNGWTVSHDSQNRIWDADNPGASRHLRLYYDGLNRQVMRDVTVNGVVTRTQFVYDGWNLIEEYDGNGAWVDAYLHGAQTDEVLARFGGTSSLLWYHQDGRGNIGRVSDVTGYWTERYTYDLGGTPFIYNTAGASLSASAVNNRFLFQGRDYIKEANIYDYRNRFYSPSLNRFLEPDPIGFEGGDENLYRHCGGDAVNNVDPSGLWQVTLLAAHVVGGYVSFGHNSGQWNFQGAPGVGEGLFFSYTSADQGRHAPDIGDGFFGTYGVSNGVTGVDVSGYYQMYARVGKPDHSGTISGNVGHIGNGLKVSFPSLEGKLTGFTFDLGSAAFIGYLGTAYTYPDLGHFVDNSNSDAGSCGNDADCVTLDRIVVEGTPVDQSSSSSSNSRSSSNSSGGNGGTGSSINNYNGTGLDTGSLGFLMNSIGMGPNGYGGDFARWDALRKHH